MASILRVRAQWSGFQGAPGYNLFHFGDFSSPGWTPDDSQSAVDRTRTFFNGLAQVLPGPVSVQVLGDVDVLDPTTGELQEVHAVTQPALVQGSVGSTVSFASPVGAVVGWRTNQVRNGRRMRGRTFLVPLSSTSFETNGTLLGNAITIINTAATALRTSTGTTHIGVYGRPSAPGATDGIWAQASANTCPDMGAVLRSRRD